MNRAQQSEQIEFEGDETYHHLQEKLCVQYHLEIKHGFSNEPCWQDTKESAHERHIEQAKASYLTVNTSEDLNLATL